MKYGAGRVSTSGTVELLVPPPTVTVVVVRPGGSDGTDTAIPDWTN